MNLSIKKEIIIYNNDCQYSISVTNDLGDDYISIENNSMMTEQAPFVISKETVPFLITALQEIIK